MQSSHESWTAIKYCLDDIKEANATDVYTVPTRAKGLYSYNTGIRHSSYPTEVPRK